MAASIWGLSTTGRPSLAAWASWLRLMPKPAKLGGVLAQAGDVLGAEALLGFDALDAGPADPGAETGLAAAHVDQAPKPGFETDRTDAGGGHWVSWGCGGRGGRGRWGGRGQGV